MSERIDQAASLPSLAAVRAVLEAHCVPGVELGDLKATHINPNSDGTVRVLYEGSSPVGQIVRVAARQIAADKGRLYEAELNASSGGLKRSAVYSEDLGFLFQFFPADQRLPALAAATDPHAMAAILEGALAPRASERHVEDIDIEVVRYKPARKCLLRYRLTWSGPDRAHQPDAVYGKLTERGKFEQAQLLLPRIHAAATKQTTFRLPEPLGVVRHLGMQLFSHVPGVELFALADASALVRHSGELGHALADFHDLDVELPVTWTAAEYKGQLMEGAREFAELRPEQRYRIATTAGGLAMWLESTPPPTRARLTHGDFHGNNVLVEGETLALIDIEDCVLGDPADDVGSLWAELALLALAPGPHAEQAMPARDAFIQAYTSHADPGTATRVPLHAAIRCFLLAYQRARRPKASGGVDVVEGLLRTCEGLLGGAAYGPS